MAVYRYESISHHLFSFTIKHPHSVRRAQLLKSLNEKKNTVKKSTSLHNILFVEQNLKFRNTNILFLLVIRHQ